MLIQEIVEALETTATNADQSYIGKKANTSKRAIHAHRDTLMRFLSELDAGLTVGEIRSVLEDYE